MKASVLLRPLLRLIGRTLLCAGCLAFNASAENLTITLHSESYQITTNGAGEHNVIMTAFGALNVPGEPQLPSRQFLIAVPPGAMVRKVQFLPQAAMTLPGIYKIAPAKSMVEGAWFAEGNDPQTAIAAASRWQSNYDRVYAQNEAYPGQVATYEGAGRWRNYSYIRIKFCPMQYRPQSGRLEVFPALTVSIDYDVPNQYRVAADHTMDDLIAPHLLNFQQAQTWFAVQTETGMAEQYDYVIVVENEDMAAAVQTFKVWKEKIGFNVKVVTTDSIYQHVSGRDDAERLWNFMRVNSEAWGLRYALLIGDIDRLPQRMLYPSDSANPYASDFYYACLNISWDVDGDNRWGEFSDDSFFPTPDVLVGRIPFNDTTAVSAVCANIIAFEQDNGAWKNKTLMASGILDYSSSGKTDVAVLSEYLKTHVFDPHNWSYTTLYEKNGLSPSSYSCDLALSQSNLLSYCQPQQYSIYNLSAHGNPNSLGSMVWATDLNKNGVCDGQDKTAEWTYTSFSSIGGISKDCVSSLVFLNGCSTGPLLGDDANFAASSDRSLYLITARRNSMAKEYIENGAVAVIASSAGSDYCGNWAKPADGHSQSLDYYYHDFLVNQDQRMGDAYYNAHMQYASNHTLQRGILVFGYLGDPSINLRGFEDHPGGSDIVVHDSTYYDFAADNADGGDMYVAVLTNNPKTAFFMGFIEIYKSTDHGTTWSRWHSVSARVGFRALDILVSEFGSDEFKDPRLLLITSNFTGEVTLYRISLTTGYEDKVILIDEGVDNEIWNIHLARDPIPKSFRVYVAYDVHNAKSASPYLTKFCRSSSNGISWQDWATHNDYHLPGIDAGPYNKVYLAAIKNNQTEDVGLLSSSDGGASWSGWTNLSANDGAVSHDASAPCVAASTDGAIPTVWVAYSFEKEAAFGSDIRYAYSVDAGANWKTAQTLSSSGGDEKCMNMKGYRAGPSRWMNITYVYGDNNPSLMWQWTSGSYPVQWSVARLVNDVAMSAVVAPKVVYSPGATATGSGVVYGGAHSDKVYFSAPWLSTRFQLENYGQPDQLALETESAAGKVTLKIYLPEADSLGVAIRDAAGRLVRTYNEVLAQGWIHLVWHGQDDNGSQLNAGTYLCTAQSGTASITRPLQWQPPPSQVTQTQEHDGLWQNTAELEQAFLVTSLIATHDGNLLASAVSNIDEMRNEGQLFLSNDRGKRWERIGLPPECWSLCRLLQTAKGTLLAGGLLLEGTEAKGMIFRKESSTPEWKPVLIFPEGCVYDIIELEDGRLFAVSGFHGRIFRSENDGLEWHEIFSAGPGTHIYTIVFAGELFIGGSRPDHQGFIWTSADGAQWAPMEGLQDAVAVYDLLAMPDKLLAAVRGKSNGWVYQLFHMPLQWTKLVEFPDRDVRAVQSLMADEAGALYAGVEMSTGLSSSKVYRLSPPYNQWRLLGGELDMANAVYALLGFDGALFAGTGPIYGNIYRCEMATGVEVEEEDQSRIPEQSDLSLNYPNPFNPATRLDYQVGREQAQEHVSIRIYDLLGREVRCLVDDVKKPGYYSVNWDGRDFNAKRVASGLYFCRMRARAFVRTVKLVVSK